MPSAMPVISHPEAAVEGGGKNAKAVAACTDLYLGDQGIEKLRGFEPFINLKSLWINNNRLKKINNLDQNFRIRALYAQDNQICTLKGCLPVFKFLEVLDLSNNVLRDLRKIMDVLCRFTYLKSLNLTGNPCVEEPDYRLIVIDNLPSLQVLDNHAVTEPERAKARLVIGGCTETLTVAFMERIPPYESSTHAHKYQQMVMEQARAKEATAIRDKRAAEQYAADTALFAHNPYPEVFTSTSGARTLPPNAGFVNRARGGGGQQPGMASTFGGAFRSQGGNMATMGGGLGAGGGYGMGRSTTLKSAVSQRSAPASQQGGATARPHAGSRRAAAPALGNSPYVPRDVLVMFSTSPGSSPLQEAGTRFSGVTSAGGIRFEQERYEEFVRLRTHGREKWRLEKYEVAV